MLISSQTQTTPWFNRLKILLSLSWPVLISQLASMSMVLIDTIIVGHTTTNELAAVGLGSAFFVLMLITLVGVGQATLPLVAHKVGANNWLEATNIARQGIVLTLILGVIATLIMLFPAPLLRITGADSALCARTEQYMQFLAISLIAQLIQKTLQSIANGIGHPRPLMIISIIEPFFHLPLCYILVNGQVSFLPPLMHGAVGAALSQSIIALFALIISVLIIHRNPVFKNLPIFSRGTIGIINQKQYLVQWLPKWQHQREILRLGVPTGIAYGLEVSAFTAIAMLVAKLGATQVSAHRIAINLASFLYMVPLSFAIATAGSIGRALGAGDYNGAKELAFLGINFTVLIAGVLGIILWFLRTPISQIMSNDPELQRLTGHLLLYICLFQIFDAAQTVAGFSLRAYKITFLPMLASAISFLGIGLGVGSILAYGDKQLGVIGYWQALLIATFTISIMLLGLLLRVIKGTSLNLKIA